MPMQRPRLSEPSFQFPHLPVSSSPTVPNNHRTVSRRLSKRLSDPHLHHYLSNRALPPTPVDQLPFVHSVSRPSASSSESSPSKPALPRSEHCSRQKGNCTVRVAPKKRRTAARRTLSVSARTCPAKWEGFEVRAFGGAQDELHRSPKSGHPFEINYGRQYPNANNLLSNPHVSSIYCVPDRPTANSSGVEKWLGEISVCPGYKSDNAKTNRKSTEIFCVNADEINWGKPEWHERKDLKGNERRNSSEGDTSGVESNQTDRCYSDKTLSLAREGGVCTSAYCSDLSAGVDSVIDSGSFHNSSVRSTNSVSKNTNFITGKQFIRRKSSPSCVDSLTSGHRNNRKTMNSGGTVFLNSNDLDFRSLHRKHSSPANIGHTSNNNHAAPVAGSNKPTFLTVSIRQNSCATSGSEAFFNLALRPSDARCDKITLVPAPANNKVARSASCAATLARKHSHGYNASHGNIHLKNNAYVCVPKISEQPPTAFLTIRPFKAGDLVHDGASRQDGSRVTRTCRLPIANLAASVQHHQSLSAKRSLIDDWITDCHAQNSNYNGENLAASGGLFNGSSGACAQMPHENVQNEPKSMTATHGRRKRSSQSKSQRHGPVSDAAAAASSWQPIEQVPVRESAPPYRTSSHADPQTEQLRSDVAANDGDVQKREIVRNPRKGKVVRSKSTVYPPSFSVNQVPYLVSSRSVEEAINPLVLIDALNNHKNLMRDNTDYHDDHVNGAFELTEAENSPPRYTQTPIKSVFDHLPAHSTLPVHRRQPHFRSMGSLLPNESEDVAHHNFIKPSLLQNQVSWQPEPSKRTFASRPHRSQSMRHPGEENIMQHDVEELHYSNNSHLLLSPLASSVSNFTLASAGRGKLEPPQLPPRPKHLMCPQDDDQSRGVPSEWVSSWCPGLCQWGVRRSSCDVNGESEESLGFGEKNEDSTGIGGSVMKMYRGTIKSAVNCMFRKYFHALGRTGVGAPLSNGLTADMPQKRMVRAMYDYKAAQKGDLSLVQDEEYEVLEETEEHWWKLRDKHGNEGYSPSNYVKEATDIGLHQYDWYLGDATRQRAETILMREEREGCFVVRNSSSTTGMYTISVYCSMSRPQVKHYHIQKDSEGKYYLSHNIKCNSISELIYKHQYNPGGLCTRLRSAPLGNKPPATAGFSRDKWDIPLNEITLLEEIGSGQFGVVRRGKYRGMDVAVKMMKEGTMSEDEFIEEAKVMTKLQHPNLVQLYGVCKRQRPVYIITEFLEYGSLLHYLRQKEKVLSAKTDTLIDMCLQICEGMAYLEKEKFIHRDLAARNCLVGSKNIKVGDFGLARYVVDDEYTGSGGAKFPIKWAAPEVLNYMRFSSKSDVWAFGVLMWEVFTCGKMPYGRRKNADVVAMVQEGIVLDQPRYCPHNVYQVMRECWEQSADQRPSFHDLKTEIGRLNAED